MRAPGIYVGPHTRHRLVFVRAREVQTAGGEVLPDFDMQPQKRTEVMADVQPSPHTRLMIPGLAETYETTYEITLAGQIDILPKDRCVLFGAQAEVVSANFWPTSTELLVGTMPVHGQ